MQKMTLAFTFIFLASIFGFLLHYILDKLNSPKRGATRLPPGPRPWPIIGNLFQLGPKPHQTLASLSLVYGPLMHLKIGLVHVVVASSASVAEQFLKVHDANFLSRPPKAITKYIYNNEDLVFRPYGKRWRWLRKICALHLFSNKTLDRYIDVRQEEVKILIAALSNVGQRPVHLGQMVNVCVTNALARVMVGRRVLGHELGCADKKAEEFKALVWELMVLSGAFSIGEYIPPLDCLDLQGHARKMKKLRKSFFAFLSSIIETDEVAHEINGDKNILSRLISLKEVGDDEGEMITDGEIKALFLNLFAAGTDTTSSTVEWIIVELLRHPKILAQAQAELNDIVGRDRLVTESDLANLSFCQAIVKEGFRLHPPTPLSLPRLAQESCEVNGHFIPKGSTLIVNVWAIGRNPDLWSDPLEFRPERFLVGGERPNADVRGNDFEVIPFSAGRRICPGVTLGIRVVQLLTTNLIHAFDFELPNERAVETLNMEEAFGLTLQRVEPLVVHPKPRLPPLAYESQKIN